MGASIAPGVAPGASPPCWVTLGRRPDRSAARPLPHIGTGRTATSELRPVHRSTRPSRSADNAPVWSAETDTVEMPASWSSRPPVGVLLVGTSSLTKRSASVGVSTYRRARNDRPLPVVVGVVGVRRAAVAEQFLPAGRHSSKATYGCHDFERPQTKRRLGASVRVRDGGPPASVESSPWRAVAAHSAHSVVSALWLFRLEELGGVAVDG